MRGSIGSGYEVSAGGSQIVSCPSTRTCEYFASNPQEGITSFDSVPSAIVGLLRALTFDDWTLPMYELMQAQFIA